ncbi:hypothetical protein GCM10007884_01180 [Methylobacterium brachythecii]|uniref:Uncharacterized protein n=1 Tax=Methylobacterium brachythecii TaxID=1176177 RepID=A0ABQ6CVN7_9HYPH|nr:hypothetical protein GCM10007884_01180 [Methylobacterium brachythecii]
MATPMKRRLMVNLKRDIETRRSLTVPGLFKAVRDLERGMLLD